MKKSIEEILNPSKNTNRWLYIILIGLIFICCTIAYFLFTQKPKIIYNTTKPILGNITQTISATGTLSATNDVEIGSQISGTISKVYVDVNDNVKKGQILAEINPNKLKQTLDGYEAQLNSAKANLESSKVTLQQKKWNYERLEKLYKATKGQSPSQLELQTAKLDFLQAQADVKIKQASMQQIQTNINAAKIDLQNSIITSPIDGIILTREVSAGQTVAASLNTPTLFTLAENLKDMKLVVNISESDIGKVKVNQKVSFNVDAYPNQTFYAKVNRVNFASTTTDNITSYETNIFVDNEQLLLRPGMSATANIEVASAKNAMLIPIAAIFYQPNIQTTQKKKSNASLFPAPPPRQKRSINNAKNINGTNATIWILKDNIPQEISIEVGVSNSKFVQVLSKEITQDTLIITDSIIQ
ncbi:efflux RND transporter periplasmic adaptor subunit [Helicobacter anseris]|uniref:Efflux RND transporter periplasmic adaptor subunit n=1 Tax=Helicobacter anseris TaxID=375926 RepID=A0A3D8J193_9HELI|nr:efflux RND transporter periplasmic adaptor subunit [Helicobacter anseris]RDU71292.1 efflux RND transporter periplasmic adaptor subunit [Helicobacter anseris]